MPAGINFEFNFQVPQNAIRRSPDAPMHILLMGNFSGHTDSGTARQALGRRRIHSIDIDDFDQVVARIAPRLELTQPIPTRIDFSELDDFHPDVLYRRLTSFAELRNLRKQLSDPATAATTIAAINQAGPTTTAEAKPAEPAGDSDTLFEQLIGGKPAGAAPSPVETSIDRLLHSIVAGHVVQSPDVQPYLDGLDKSLAEVMDGILHHPDYQDLEAAWRGVYWLVSELVTDTELKIFLLDVDHNELAADLVQSGGEPRQTVLYQRLLEVDGGADRQPWSMIVALREFPATADAVGELALLTTITRLAGGPLLAGAASDFVGCDSFVSTPDYRDWQTPSNTFAEAWQAFRRSGIAPSLGLALPRVLLRLPYGAQTDPLDGFDYEEQRPLPEHQRYLWGNPALACALVFGRAFLEQGWNANPAAYLDLDGLPAHIVKHDGESQMQACAEAYLSEAAADRIDSHGLIPLLSYRNRDVVRVGGLMSAALQRSPLAAVWTS